ncbi:hypothetical protein [Rheinheimera sp.]|uniref:hypothetical protein n=1 Tax=Rheinheimera sp. TaxID=1869214 RepID=UPI0027B8AE6A|nr:hypothetical protein [Rheinheimera sp.]
MQLTVDPYADKSYVRQLKQLISSLLSISKFQHSVYGQASQFFQQQQQQKNQLSQLQQAFDEAQRQLGSANAKSEARLVQQAQQCQQALKAEQDKQEQKRLNNYSQLYLLCQQFLQMIEGNNRAETILRSSKMLGTLQLLAPSEGEQIATVQQKYKPFYKATLSLRLLDHLLAQGMISSSYILQKAKARKTSVEAGSYCPFRDDVQIPLLMALLLQDIGHSHPEALLILTGPDGKLPRSRELQTQERSRFLDISLQASLQFLLKGIGAPRYRGNSRPERDAFDKNEQDKLAFATTLLKNAGKPGAGVGNLLKIPQVYASAVLPGRNRFDYQALPKVALILKTGAAAGQYDERMVQSLLSITGIFPQGYGIVFLPKDAKGQPLDRYEFAIVNSLYPPQPEAPLCRIVTRNLHYRHNLPNCNISVASNLYFKPARQQLEIIPQQRLEEILKKLSSDFAPGRLRRLLPRYWHPDEFFADPRHQNLWNRTELRDN